MQFFSTTTQENEVCRPKSGINLYPGGAVMPGRSFISATGYRYGFNGKENDNEVKNITGSQQDYGFRIYDPRLGRFLSVDPLTKGYPMLTPYQFASNTPICAIDLDGLEAKLETIADTKFEALSKQLNAAAIQQQVKAQVVEALAQDAFDKLPDADKKLVGAKDLFKAEISQGINVFIQMKEVTAFNGTKSTEITQIIVTPSGYDEKRAQAMAAEGKANTSENIKNIAITVLKKIY